MTDTLFTSDKNYMKRNPISGSTTVQGPATNKVFSYTSEASLTHGLGYVPMFRTYYEPYLDGRVFEAFQDVADGLPEPINSTSITYVAPLLLSWADENKLWFQSYFNNNSLSANNYPVHGIIYNDYGLSTAITDDTSATSDYKLDRILSAFDGITTNYTVGAATLSGGLYLPKTDVYTIPNPIGQKALPTMVYSIDGGNTYLPQRYRLYQPGNPPESGRVAAVAGMAVDQSFIYFYFTHYLGVSVNFKMFWTLDAIE